jgi:hypothetical protein
MTDPRDDAWVPLPDTAAGTVIADGWSSCSQLQPQSFAPGPGAWSWQAPRERVIGRMLIGVLVLVVALLTGLVTWIAIEWERAWLCDESVEIAREAQERQEIGMVAAPRGGRVVESEAVCSDGLLESRVVHEFAATPEQVRRGYVEQATAEGWRPVRDQEWVEEHDDWLPYCTNWPGSTSCAEVLQFVSTVPDRDGRHQLVIRPRADGRYELYLSSWRDDWGEPPWAVDPADN